MNKSDPQGVQDLLEEVRDYFDQRADAEIDSLGVLPNQEMQILCRIDEVLSNLRRLEGASHDH